MNSGRSFDWNFLLIYYNYCHFIEMSQHGLQARWRGPRDEIDRRVLNKLR